MLIQNKTTDETVEVTDEKWESLRKLGWNAHWRVVSKTEPLSVSKELPKEIIEILPKKKKVVEQKEGEI